MTRRLWFALGFLLGLVAAGAAAAAVLAQGSGAGWLSRHMKASER